MILPRSIALRALARPARIVRLHPRSSQPPLKQSYSSASGASKPSSSLPWALSAIAATAIGTYIVIQPSGGSSSHHDEHHAEDNPPPNPIQDKLDEKKEAAKRDLEKAKAMLPKKERDGDSVKNHSIAAEKNEHKIRTGKFSKEEFDNHIQEHTDDPGKDFEKIKKEEAEEKASK